MKKALLCLLALLLILSFAACTPKQPVELELPDEPPTVEPPDVETPDVEPPIEMEPAQPISEVDLKEINIFHLGIRTPLSIDEDHATALAQQLLELMENAAAMDSMEAPPESALNPMQVMGGHTALELVYAGNVELPLSIEGEPLTARRLLFSIPVSSNEGGLLYTGYELYRAAPICRLFDQTLQNAIFNSASDQVERVTFAADGNEVLINGQVYHYVSGDDAAELSGRLLNRILYRSIAFYLNAYTGNVNGLQSMSTGKLYDAVLKAHAGLNTEYGLGEGIIANFNSYILADFFLPQTIVAPVQQDENYQVLFNLNEMVTVEMDFAVEEDMPLVSALKLVITE